MNRLLLLLSLAAACSGKSSTQEEDLTLIQACSWPQAAATFNASTGQGCQPQSMFEICEVPSGSSVRPDGGIVTPDGGAASCDDACSPAEYSLTCTGAGPGSIPDSGPSLGCKAVPIPTPSGALFYCCPCAR